MLLGVDTINNSKEAGRATGTTIEAGAGTIKVGCDNDCNYQTATIEVEHSFITWEVKSSIPRSKTNILENE